MSRLQESVYNIQGTLPPQPGGQGDLAALAEGSFGRRPSPRAGFLSWAGLVPTTREPTETCSALLQKGLNLDI